MRLKSFLADQFSLGKGAVKLPIASLIENYRKRYETLRQTYKTFNYTIWYVRPSGRTIVHFKIPSETVKNFFYDVLLELDRGGSASTFEDCNVKVFSNCPSFVYTYAHVFYTMKDPETGETNLIIDKFNQKIPKDRLLVPGAEKTLPKEALTDAPEMRNPANLNLPDKSIYYAIFYLLDMLDFRRVMYSRHSISMTQLLRTVSDFDVLMQNRSAMEKKQKAEEREIKKAVKAAFKKREAEIAKSSGVTSSVRKTRPIKSSRTTKIRPIKPVSSSKKK